MAALGMMVTTFALESEDLGVESHIMRDLSLVEEPY